MNKIPLSGFCLLLKSRHKHLFRIMRITYMLLFAAIFCLHAENAISQKITLQGDNLSVKDYLNTIEKQTDYLFIYDAGVNVNKRISVNMVGKSIKEVLDNLSTQLGLNYSQKGSYIVLSSYKAKETSAPVIAQQKKTITGVVTDDLGEPIIGANVIEKGTTNGIITDIDGKFTLEVAPGAVVQVSYIGYNTQEVKVGNQSTLAIQLVEDTQALSEVVVVGYGVQRKVTTTGAVTKLEGDEINKMTVVNATKALQGLSPGITVVDRGGAPGSDDPEIYLRGVGTTGNAKPLVLVDGIERDFNDVDVNEIESISVLKDASATAVYGVKGANGVILLTTKRGLEQKPEISFTANFGFKQPSAAPEWSDYVTSMKQYNRAQANDGNWGAMVPESTITAWENAYATGNYGPYNDVFPEVDWWKELVKNVGYEQAYNLNVRGGTKKMSYFVSLGYLHDGDIFNTTKQEDFDPSFSYRRYNWRSNFDFNITSTTKLSFNVAGKMGYQNQPSYYENVDSPDERFFKTFFTAPSNEFPIKYSNGIWGDGLSSDQNIACLMNEGGSRNIKQHQGFYDVILNQKLDFITKGLSLKASLSYTTSSSWTTQIMPGKILGKDDLVAQRTHIRINRVYDYANPIYNADGTITYNYTEKRYPDENAPGDLPDGGVYDGFKAYGRKLYYELALNYSRHFGDHDVSA